jgi:predicted ABC-type ATPase
MKKTCFIVAGPNGAGKSTFAESFLPNEANCFYFVNADMIAKGISPLRPENAGVEAGKILFRKIEEYSNRDITFAFESTLSGTGHLRRIESLKKNGYRIVIYYLQLASEVLAIERVRCRVREGGHNIPDADIRRRFKRSWLNFRKLYRNLADEWIVFDNSGDDPIVLESSS